MRVLIINGSPHRDGVTSRLTDACLSALPDATLTRFDCFQTPPAPCDDCRFCRTTNGCRHHDLDDFYASLEAAELLIFATPVYNRSFPAPMKAVLDRLQRYWSARFIRGVRPPIAVAKQTVLLTAGGSSRADGALLEAQLAPVLTVLNSAPLRAVHAQNTDGADDLTAVLDAARAVGASCR